MRAGKVPLTRKAIAQLIGKVFIQKSAVNLLSTVLDTPEFFWSAPDSLQSLYKRCCEYVEYDTRVEVLNSRFQVGGWVGGWKMVGEGWGVCGRLEVVWGRNDQLSRENDPGGMILVARSRWHGRRTYTYQAIGGEDAGRTEVGRGTWKDEGGLLLVKVWVEVRRPGEALLSQGMSDMRPDRRPPPPQRPPTRARSSRVCSTCCATTRTTFTRLASSGWSSGSS